MWGFLPFGFAPGIGLGPSMVVFGFAAPSPSAAIVPTDIDVTARVAPRVDVAAAAQPALDVELRVTLARDVAGT